jgi:adenylate kinase family enzyme
VFHTSTAPVIAHYETLGLLHRIDAARPIGEVYADAERLLRGLDGSRSRVSITAP